MAVLSRDEFFERIHSRMPNVTGDEDISFLEDMTDTYNDLETRTRADAEDWKRKYNELDKSWKEKYKHRFFSGGDRSVPSERKSEEEFSSETITVEDLFEEVK